MSQWSFLKEGLQYAPSLVGAIVIVVLFLRYLNARDKRDIEKEVMLQQDFDKRDDVLKGISSQGFEIHKQSNEVIKENTQVLGAVKHALDQLLRVQVKQ